MNDPIGRATYATPKVASDEIVAARGLPAGAIFKPVATNLFADLGPDWKRYNQTYDPKTTLTPAQQTANSAPARTLRWFSGTPCPWSRRTSQMVLHPTPRSSDSR